MGIMGRSAWAVIVGAIALLARPAACAAQILPASPDPAVTRAGRFLLPGTAAAAARIERAQDPAPLPPALPAPTQPHDLASTADLDPAPLAPGDLQFPINLATALRLSDARPLIVAAAQASVWVAEGQLTRAKVLWVPALNMGFDYIRHDGGGPDFNKGIMTAPSVNFFWAGGGMWQNVPLTDALFAPWRRGRP